MHYKQKHKCTKTVGTATELMELIFIQNHETLNSKHVSARFKYCRCETAFNSRYFRVREILQCFKVNCRRGSG